MTPQTREKYFNAIHEIATSPKPPAERLADAWVKHLMHADRGSNPPEIGDELEKLAGFFSEIQDDEHGSALASARTWDDSKISEVAESFAQIALFYEE